MVGSKYHQIKRAWGGTLPFAAFNFSLCSHHPHSKKKIQRQYFIARKKNKLCFIFLNIKLSKKKKKSDAKFIGWAAAKNLFA
jgi:hypothetical protein